MRNSLLRPKVSECHAFLSYRPALLARDETAAGITTVLAPWPGQKSISNTAYPHYLTAS